MVRPFVEPGFNKIEIFNEICILGCSYHLLAFTDFISIDESNDKIRLNFGYSMIGFTVLNIIVNTSIMMFQTFRKLKRNVLLLIRRFKN